MPSLPPRCSTASCRTLTAALSDSRSAAFSVSVPVRTVTLAAPDVPASVLAPSEVRVPAPRLASARPLSQRIGRGGERAGAAQRAVQRERSDGVVAVQAERGSVFDGDRRGVGQRIGHRQGQRAGQHLRAAAIGVAAAQREDAAAGLDQLAAAAERAVIAAVEPGAVVSVKAARSTPPAPASEPSVWLPPSTSAAVPATVVSGSAVKRSALLSVSTPPVTLTLLTAAVLSSRLLPLLLSAPLPRLACTMPPSRRVGARRQRAGGWTCRRSACLAAAGCRWCRCCPSPAWRRAAR